EAMTPTLEIFAMLQFRYNGSETMTRPVHLIGIDPAGRAQVGGFSEHLVQQRGSTSPTFKLSREAQQHYDDMHQPPPLMLNDLPRPVLPGEKPGPEPPPSTPYVPHGIIVGHAIASYRVKGAHADTEVKDKYVLQPGDDVIITTISGAKLIPVYDRF